MSVNIEDLLRKSKKAYNYNPQPDITTYELAVCIPIVFGILISNKRGVFVEEAIESLTPNVRRHFIVEED